MKNKILLMNMLLAAFLLCFLSACGKVGDPRPRLPHGDEILSRLEAVNVSNLTMSQSQGGILLLWDVSGDDSVLEKIRIYRSDFNIKEGDCPDCPPLRKMIIKELSREEMKGNVQDDGQYAYEDRDVQPEFLYKYSLQLCADRDVCQNPSLEAAIQLCREEEESEE